MSNDGERGRIKRKTVISLCRFCGGKATFRDGEDEGSLWLGCISCDVGLEAKQAGATYDTDLTDLGHELGRIWNETQKQPITELDQP